MELRQLHYFLAIAECENMTQAANMIHVSQPTLSTTLRDLERELGFPLFNRTGKRLSLNESGRYFAKRVREALDLLEEAQQTARDNAHTRERIVNCALEIPVGHPGELLRSFRLRHPEIVIRMGYPDSSTFYQQVIDLTLFGSLLEVENEHTTLLGKEQFVGILPSDHPLADKDSFELRMLKDEPFILTNPSELRTTVIEMCHEAGFQPNIITETQLYSEALSLVESGIGCTVGTTFTWLGKQRFNVSAKIPRDVQRMRYLYAHRNSDIETSQATKTFIEFLQSYAQEVMQEYTEFQAEENQFKTHKRSGSYIARK